MSPQVAIKMLQHFDRIVSEVLAEKVKARLSFKVLRLPPDAGAFLTSFFRAILIPTASATKSGPS